MLDLLIRGGTVVDGTGQPAFTADIAVEGGTITGVGKVGERARETIDADGAIVTPGWIDTHTHYDGQITWDDTLEGSAANGVTTVITGNCGVGFAPVRPGQAGNLIDLMEGVEDIPGTALHEGIPWGAWEGFGDYLDFLCDRRWSLDVGLLLPHGPLRYYVMGERSWADGESGAATADDIAELSRLARMARAVGALGFSTSRILFHRAMSGFTVPGTFAEEEELTAIARGMRSAGPSVLQAIPGGVNGEVSGKADPHGLSDEVRMFGRLSRAADVGLTFTTAQSNEDPESWRIALKLAAEENAAGARLAPMIMPRAATVLTTLRGYHYFMQRPTYLALAGLPHAELVAQLRRPEVKAAILAQDDVPDARPGSMQNILPPLFRRSLPRTFPMREPLDYEPELSGSLASRAAAAGRDPFEYLYDFLLEDEGTSVAMYLSANYAHGSLDPCREMLLDPNTVSGLSDAGAHVNFICDMAVPTFHFTHWARDRRRGETVPLEAVVAKGTGVAARTFGLSDRGILAPGKRADVNVIDLAALTIHRPVLRHDLPAGGSRFLQTASGYLATIVNGVRTRHLDADTGQRPGRLATPGC